jgi:hypothetical protein
MTEENTQIATTQQPSSLATMQGLTPQTLNEAKDFAVMLAKSGLLPKPLRGQPSDVLVILLTGAAHDLSPMQAISAIHVIEGRASLAADLLVALCLRSPVCEYFDLVETTDEKATYQTKRRGREPVTLSYTADQAKKAGVMNRDNWAKHTADMLRHRCSSKLARAVFPDVIQGLYTPDELEDIRAAEVVVTSSPVVVAEAEPFDLDTGEVAEPPRDRI